MFKHLKYPRIAPFASMVWERWVRSKLGPPDGDRIDPDDEDEGKGSTKRRFFDQHMSYLKKSFECVTRFCFTNVLPIRTILFLRSLSNRTIGNSRQTHSN